MKKLLFSVLSLFLVNPLFATRVVPGYTIQDPTVSNISQVTIRPAIDGSDDLIMTVYYKLEANTPNIVVDQKFESVNITLSGSIKTTMANFLTTNAIP